MAKSAAHKKSNKKSSSKTTKKSLSQTKPNAVGNRGRQVFGYDMQPWITGLTLAKASDLRGKAATLIVFGSEFEKKTKPVLSAHLQSWQMNQLQESPTDWTVQSGKLGPVFILRTQSSNADMKPGTSSKVSSSEEPQNGNLNHKEAYAWARDYAGMLWQHLKQNPCEKLVLEFYGVTEAEQKGILVGLELSAYSFVENSNPKKRSTQRPSLFLRKTENFDSKELEAAVRSAAVLAQSMNLTRHLINTPGSALNPKTYADAVRSIFASEKYTQIEIWDDERLAKEGMGMLRAVGAGSVEGPCMVHIRYRPPTENVQKPIAFVGKGITFDSGGLDIKPSSAMRWMKKDMGGSAAVVGVAHWAVKTQLSYPCDFYLAIAENSISANSFRPGDILTARNGMTVEIHNTDAEGRLALGDVLDVAATQAGEDAPLAIVDVATLTGAIKIGLGAEIAGLFCNHDGLSQSLLEASFETGDLAWRMPLYQPYKQLFRSTFADVANASDGFAGAITAALFLQNFVRDIPWAHLDIYAWKDSAGGPFSEAGGNGQSVQMLAKWLEKIANHVSNSDSRLTPVLLLSGSEQSA